jgi:hypothetical protein
MDRRGLPIIVGLFALGTIWVWFVTRASGPGLCSDAMSYLSAAEALARGAEPQVPFAEWWQQESHHRLRHFPPGFPALIAVPTALGLPVAQAARWVEALAAGALAALVGLVAVSCVKRERRRAAALATGLGVLLAPAISLSFFIVLSEPPFLALYALALLMMLVVPERCLALGVCAAACALTRYAGVSVAPAVVLWSLVQPGTLRARCGRALLAGAPTVLAVGLWRAWSGSFRRYAWYVDGLAANAREAWHTLCQALVPIPERTRWEGLQELAAAGVAVLMSVLLVREARRRVGTPGVDRDAPVAFDRLWRALTLMAACYVATVVTSRLRADADIPFDWRILSPLVLSLHLVVTIALVRHWHVFASRAWRGCAAALVASWFVAAGWNATHNVWSMLTAGACYDGPAWQGSAFARWLRGPGRHYALYSNDPAAVWHLDHRSSWLLPETADAPTLAVFAERVRARPSAVLGFASAFDPTADPRQLASLVGLFEQQASDLVTVWTTDP